VVGISRSLNQPTAFISLRLYKTAQISSQRTLSPREEIIGDGRRYRVLRMEVWFETCQAIQLTYRSEPQSPFFIA
jgi:hypothetical protein